MTQSAIPHLGWIPDWPDPRDYALQHDEAQALLSRLKRSRKRRPPQAVDLRGDEEGVYFSPPADQGGLNASPVHACLSVVEYFERRALGNTFEPSALFLYRMARKLRGFTGDTGVDLRSTLKALTRFGVPPQRFWPYVPEKFDSGPCDLSLMGFAREFVTLRYVRLDQPRLSGPELLETVKSLLTSGFPVAFGFPVPYSLKDSPDIPYRPAFDGIRGGQAVVAVGFDDQHPGSSKGALLIRNSWGTQWGDQGYGWLPYAYVENQLARDFWLLLREDWLDSGEFASPSILASEVDSPAVR